MKKLVLIALATGALFVSAGTGFTQYYPEPEYGFQGPRYDDRYDRRYDDRYDRRYDDRRYRYRDERRNYRPAARCPYSYTVQDGVCKPYTGR